VLCIVQLEHIINIIIILIRRHSNRNHHRVVYIVVLFYLFSVENKTTTKPHPTKHQFHDNPAHLHIGHKIWSICEFITVSIVPYIPVGVESHPTSSCPVDNHCSKMDHNISAAYPCTSYGTGRSTVASGNSDCEECCCCCCCSTGS
jgi:hypothetical protein